MASQHAESASFNSGTLSNDLKFDAEDTDAVIEAGTQSPVAHAGQKKPLGRGNASPLLRCVGGFVLAVALALIIYGLFFCTGANLDKTEETKERAFVKELSVKPRDETRNFKFAKLPNGIEVVTVQDQRALKKGFATAVQAGSFDNPKNLSGLAHFTEHMLFLGTKKYSDPSGFDNYIAAHGGWNNAYTSEETTVYFASVSQDAAVEGFDRFADFFNAPLFSSDYVEKEVHAIDSEHAKNVHNPNRQVMQVLYSLADKDSPLSRFHTGNLQTLQVEPKKKNPPIDPVKELKTFWEGHYCPNRMKVVTVGSETNADQLKTIEKEFGKIKAKSKECERPRPSHNSPQPWSNGHLGKWVNVQGMLPRSFLWLMFSLPDMTKNYASEPMDYIEYVLKYGGVDSLSRALKDSLGLAAAFDVMSDTTSAGTNLLMVVQLTKQGRLYKELVLDVIFSYLAKLRRDGVSEPLYKSLAAVQKLNWDWGGQENPVDTASGLAERLTRVKPDDILWADSVIAKPDPKLVHSLLSKLVPENMNVAFVKEKPDDEQKTDGNAFLKLVPENMNVASVKEKTDSEQKVNGNAFFKNQNIETLEHYGIQYSVQQIGSVLDLEPGTMDKWTSWLNGNVTATSIENGIMGFINKHSVHVIPDTVPVPKCPGPIDGIPHALTFENMHAAFTPYSNEQIVDSLLYGPTPVNLDIRRTSHSPYGIDAEVWYRGGWMVASPKVKVALTLRPLKMPDEAELPAVSDLELELYGRLLGDQMSPKLFDATVTGMSYEIQVGGNGLEFRFAGFRPSMHRLMTQVLSEFNDFNKDPKLTPEMRWEKNTHALREDLITYTDLPLNYAVSDRNLLLTKGSHSRADLLDALDNGGVTRESVSGSVSKLLLSRQLRLTAIAMGNVDAHDSRVMIGDFLHNLDYPEGAEALEAKSGAEVERLNPIVRLQKPVEVRKRNPKHGDIDDVAVVSVVYGVSTVESRVNLGLLSQLFKPLAYNELRTKQQLGYLVSGGVVQLSNVQLMSCVAQGGRLDADAMEAAIHYVFADLMPKRLTELTDEEFKAYKSSFRQDLVQPPLTMQAEFDHFAGPVDQGGIGFELQNEMLKYLDGPNVTKDSLLQVWKDFVLPEKGERQIITVKYFAKDVVPKQKTLAVANETWVKQKVPYEARLLLAREYEQTVRLNKADSEDRKALASAGGWHETVQHCKLKDGTTASKEPLHVPQQIKDLIQQRKHDIDKFESTPVVYTTTNTTRSDLTKNWARSKLKRRLRGVLMPQSSTGALMPREY